MRAGAVADEEIMLITARSLSSPLMLELARENWRNLRELEIEVIHDCVVLLHTSVTESIFVSRFPSLIKTLRYILYVTLPNNLKLYYLSGL